MENEAPQRHIVITRTKMNNYLRAASIVGQRERKLNKRKANKPALRNDIRLDLCSLS